MDYQGGDSRRIQARGITPAGVKQTAALFEATMREEEKSRRLRFVVAAILVLSAAVITVFAPEGKATTSYWIGAALVLLAGGAAGYGRVIGKAGAFSLVADSGTAVFGSDLDDDTETTSSAHDDQIHIAE